MYAQHQPRFHWWQGVSQQWWITTVLPLQIPTWSIPAVYVMVRREQDGSASPLYIGQTSDLGERMEDHARRNLISAVVMGGNELHVHLLAESKEARLTIETDLRQAHLTALNRQPTTLSELAGLFFAHRQS